MKRSLSITSKFADFCNKKMSQISSLIIKIIKSWKEKKKFDSILKSIKSFLEKKKTMKNENKSTSLMR